MNRKNYISKSIASIPDSYSEAPQPFGEDLRGWRREADDPCAMNQKSLRDNARTSTVGTKDATETRYSKHLNCNLLTTFLDQPKKVTLFSLLFWVSPRKSRSPHYFFGLALEIELAGGRTASTTSSAHPSDSAQTAVRYSNLSLLEESTTLTDYHSRFNQFGFMKGRDTTKAVTKLFACTNNALSTDKNIHVTLLYIAKAYDSVEFWAGRSETRQYHLTTPDW
ncbi:hypothetical protein PROFUN_15959 [Planoprotostelium fungivorum]|uniref:Uncharacterized protein n=1 Tax=Planoprotostelium fungivorum TaxID=1890364 RepID=A0A2P6MU59_9EUKA|nr:hypothetical protein PROFUN_15959 [Planoprotostelium fungivorum]